MTLPASDPLSYLVPRRDTFWRWTAGAAAIEWRDGRTIVFRAELEAVLMRLAPVGLPPVGSLILLLAACRDNWNDEDNLQQILAPYQVPLGEDPSARPSYKAATLVTAMVPQAAEREAALAVEELAEIHALPGDLRIRVGSKAALAEVLTERAPKAHLRGVAGALAERFSSGFDVEPLLEPVGFDDRYVHLAEELDSLRQGIAGLDEAALRARITTGIETLEIIAPALPLPPPQRARQLMIDLRSDPELGGVTSLARDLLAALHIPRALAAPLELPVGGVSDLANRGPFDRLLISELAQDDLTLITRIAMGEALYLRREAPTSTPPTGRLIVIDTGIRLWGIPRVFATAIGLALIATADPLGALAVLRAAGSTAAITEPVDLLSRQGLLDHLAALDPAPYPTDLVRSAVNSLEGTEDKTDLFLITHEDTLGDPDFLRDLAGVMQELPDRAVYVATVTRQGSFRLEFLTRAGRRMVCSARLSVDQVLGGGVKKAKSLVDPAIDPKLPVILSTRPFPLLLPETPNPQRSAFHESLGLVSIVHDGRLLWWTGRAKGATQLAATTPVGQFAGLFVDDRTRQVILLTHQSLKRQLLITTFLLARADEAPANEPWTLTIAFGHPRHAALKPGALIVFRGAEFLVFSPESHEISRHPVPPEYCWRFDQYFHGFGGIYMSWFNGIAMEFAKVSGRDCVAIFNREKLGPWQIFAGGHAASIDGPPLRVNRPATPLVLHRDRIRVSPDGHRVLAWQGNRPNRAYFLLDLSVNEKGQSDPDGDGTPPSATSAFVGVPRSISASESTFVAGNSASNANSAAKPSLLEWKSVPRFHPDPLQLVPPGYADCGINLHRHFSGVGVADDPCELALYHRGQRYAITLSGNELVLRVIEAKRDTPRYESFGPRSRLPEQRFTLRTAEWSTGSRVILDSRGLLHLISHDPHFPQITLVLAAEGKELACWTSDGQTFGWSFYHPGTPTGDASAAYDLIQRFIATLY